MNDHNGGKYMEQIGIKLDEGKDRWSLLPWRQVRDVVRVLMFGAKQYGDYNWRMLDNPEERWFDALIRHVMAWKEGEKRDGETGLPHLAHGVCCLLFLMWGDDQKEEGVLMDSEQNNKGGQYKG